MPSSCGISSTRSGCSAGVMVLVSGRPHIRLRISKNQLFRTLDDVNPIPELQQLEEYVLENANKRHWYDGIWRRNNFTWL